MVIIKKTLALTILGSILLISLVLLTACNGSSSSMTNNASDTNGSDNLTTAKDVAGGVLDLDFVEANPCPDECCTGDDGYDMKECEFDKPCVNHRCVFEKCPYDCCSGYEKYKRKKCEEGYKCVETDCEPIDDDSDGLLNIEEEKLGTDPDKADTDGDGLSDYEEIKKKKTDPLNPNMDGDRYSDSEDENPFIGSFPVVQLELTKSSQDKFDDNLQTLEDAYKANCENKVCNVDDILPVTGDLDLFISRFTLVRENVGDDYTENTDFKISIYTIDGGKERRIYPTIEGELGVLPADEKDETDYEYTIKLSDLKVGGEGVLISAALESDKFVILPKLRNVKSEGEQ